MNSPSSTGGYIPVQTQVFQPPADPFTQPVTLLLPDGTPFNVTMDQFAWFHTYGVQLAISRGVALGACAILLILLILLTQAEKRKSPIFALNVLALLLNTIRSLLSAIYLAGPFQNPYAVISGDFSQITGIDKSNSVAVPVLTLLILIVVETSLLLQIKVVLVAATHIHKIIILGVCGVMALATIGMEFAVMVINSENIINLESGFDDNFQNLLLNTSLVMMVSFMLFMLVFLGKLGYAIWQRRQIGMKQFGPMQILFIMMLQTLIVPTVISILEYCTTIPEMSTWFLTLVTLSLPLSSLWAAANIEATRSSISREPIIARSYTSSGKRAKNYFASALSEKSTILHSPSTMGPLSSSKEPLNDVELGHMRSTAKNM